MSSFRRPSSIRISSDWEIASIRGSSSELGTTSRLLTTDRSDWTAPDVSLHCLSASVAPEGTSDMVSSAFDTTIGDE